jgi:hypothetical protein
MLRSQELVICGYRIHNILQNTTSATLMDADSYRPGERPRHDNDSENFREIAIPPTPDEIAPSIFSVDHHREGMVSGGM